MNYRVQVVYNLGEKNEYIFPLVQSISDPIPAMKSTVIEGTRGSGSIVIPGGKRSIEIRIRGILYSKDGYKGLTNLMNEMRSAITTELATLTLRYWDGTTWVNNWQYLVRRIDEIEFEDSMRIMEQPYSVVFLVVSY